MTNLNEVGHSIPLWLDIKTEYIDENLDRVIGYLHEGFLHKNTQDSFFNKTVALFEERVRILLEELTSFSICQDNPDVELLEEQVRLLGTFLFLYGKDDSLSRHAYTAMLSRLMILNPEMSEDLTILAINNLVGKTDLTISNLPYSWYDMENFNSQILANKIHLNQKYLKRSVREAWVERKGTLRIANGSIDILADDRDGANKHTLVSSMELLDGLIKFYTPKADKLKKSEEDDIDGMAQFTRNFILWQKNITNKPKSKLKTYANGASLEVMVAEKYNGKVHVVSCDKGYEQIRGELKESSFLSYITKDFLKYLKEGDHLEVEIENIDSGIFDVSKTFTSYIVNELSQVGDRMNAKILSINHDKANNRKAYLWCEDGYPTQAIVEDKYQEGDVVEIRISSFGDKQYFGVINSEVIASVDNYEIDIEETKSIRIEDFLYAVEEEENISIEKVINDGEVKEICRMMATCQKSIHQMPVRYRVLCTLQIVCEMMSWEKDSRYVAFLADYLENLVSFVKGNYEGMKVLGVPKEFSEIDSIQRRAYIISLLMSYGKTNQDSFLADAAESDDELIKKLAVLIQSSNNIRSFLSRSMLNVIKREIVSALSLDDNEETDLDTENGIYLGLEGEHQEFKTSFFFAPKDAKEQIQQRTIFKGVCAFLNSRNGGTLFLGVDDLGYVKGIESDLVQLEKISCGNYRGIDGYVRYVTDEAKKYFDLSILTHVSIHSMYDEKVVALEVSPYEYDIVELEGKAYVRLNNESVQMNDATRRKILSDKINLNVDDALTKKVLMQAISDKKQVILHGYSSSNGGDIRDRNVEPFAFASGYQAIWCYDLEDGHSKVFMIDRISNVQILDENWMYEYAHKKLNMDIFRMSGEKPKHVKLQLNLMAKNILVEEYEGADKVISPTKDDDVWILDTDVYKMEGVGRFYIGLANAITILEAPELEEYVKNFRDKYLN